ncbi:metallopeptidase family protein [Henriciella aquimarina]|uniref:metallopeptidase family protein n=1 Tax=Henriciella aquimarina TaxID=545261 RepID=UPI000A0508F7|nr:metallopeptidase family protein [Henriciella aquimarina]
MSKTPDLEEFQALTEDAYASLPEDFRRAAGRIVIHVQDVADPDVLAELNIVNPMHLTGLYQGVPLIHESVTFPSQEAPRIFLYRKPLLAELATRPDVTLKELISHVVIHELGHHFGWSDEEMDAILADSSDET